MNIFIIGKSLINTELKCIGEDWCRSRQCFFKKLDICGDINDEH